MATKEDRKRLDVAIRRLRAEQERLADGGEARDLAFLIDVVNLFGGRPNTPRRMFDAANRACDLLRRQRTGLPAATALREAIRELEAERH